jgi:hypothetical protein
MPRHRTRYEVILQGEHQVPTRGYSGFLRLDTALKEHTCVHQYLVGYTPKRSRVGLFELIQRDRDSIRTLTGGDWVPVSHSSDPAWRSPGDISPRGICWYTIGRHWRISFSGRTEARIIKDNAAWYVTTSIASEVTKERTERFQDCTGRCLQPRPSWEVLGCPKILRRR